MGSVEHGKLIIDRFAEIYSTMNILTLTRKDLRLDSTNKKAKDVSIYDINGSLRPVQEAEMVLFIDSPFMKILKCRYEIVE